MDIIWVPKFAKAGLLRDLSDRISNEELAKFLPSDVDGGRYEGKLYRIPLRSDVGMLYYRKDLLEEPPETFEQLLQMARTLQKQRAIQWGYVWPGQQYEGLAATFVEILQGYGGFWINSITREVGLDRPEAVEVVEFLRGTIEQGISPRDVTGYQEEQAHNLFLQGKAVFLRDWPNVWALAKDSPVRGKIAIKPMVHAPGNSSGACKGGWGFGIAAKTRHPEAAWKAIKFFTSAAAERQLVLETGYLPSRRSLFIDPQIVGRYSHFPKLLEVIENSVLRPLIPQYDQASEILQRYLSDALTGRLSPKEAMEAAAKQTRQLMEKG
jgi:multiple sugar transport system substrate-binding protein